MLRHIGVHNLRSFKDQTKIELKPLTVFVGKNSSGKSSLLRVLPLLRQSIEANTTGPILWFGRYVDFGSFNEAVSNSSPLEPIGFHFDINLPTFSSRYFRFSPNEVNVSVDIDVVLKGLKTIFNRVKLNAHNVTVEIENKGNGYSIMSINHGGNNMIKDDLILLRPNQFIPTPAVLKRKDETVGHVSKAGVYFNEFPAHGDELSRYYIDEAVSVIRKYFNPKADVSKIKDLLSKIPFVNEDLFCTFLAHVFKEQKVFIRHLDRDKDEIISAIYPYLIGWNLMGVIHDVNREINKELSSVRYIAPLRSTTERYYRFQDLQVDEIDHTGSNLAMLLNSLRPSEQKEFSLWTKDNFGFSVFVKEVGAHYAVKIISPDDQKEYNISDMGFGYSQVLPIIVSIWMETERRKSGKSSNSIFVIEQPELHLHPAYQAKLGELFAKVVASAKAKSVDVRIIFETHSSSIIESLGEMIENDNCSITHDDVSVVVFEKNASGNTDVSIARFDESGYLMNWPVGFFSGK